MRAQLSHDVAAQVFRVEWFRRRAIDQLERVNRGHQEAHQLLEAIARHIDADHLSRSVERGAAGHPAVDRAGVMNARIERVLDLSVRHAFGDRQADVERKPDRIRALPLRRHCARKHQRFRIETFGTDDG